MNLSVRFDRFLLDRQNKEQDSTLPTLDRDYIPTVGIGMDSSYLQTVERESRRIRWLPSISVQVLYWQSRTYYDNLQREEDDGIRSLGQDWLIQTTSYEDRENHPFCHTLR